MRGVFRVGPRRRESFAHAHNVGTESNQHQQRIGFRPFVPRSIVGPDFPCAIVQVNAFKIHVVYSVSAKVIAATC